MSASAEPSHRPGSSETLLAGLAYLGPLVLVSAFAGKDSAFVQFHARQGLTLLAVLTLTSCLVWLPMIGWVVPALVSALMLVAAARAMTGTLWRLPLIGSVAEKIVF
jgi:uncharacterized membrane protein